MASIAVTYTFSNSTTADATQVNQNFTDIVNGTSDGTKDFSINAITCAGNATFNGNTAIGNASSDTLTLTASLASSVPLNVTNSYDIGSVTTLGLRAIYFASNGATKTAKLLAGSNASDINVTLPAWTSTLGVVPAVATAQTTTYGILTTDEIVPVDGTSAAFTVTLPTAVGVTGKKYTIKRIDQTLANAVTIATTSSQTIDGVTTRKLTTQHEQFTVISDGTNWRVIAHDYPSGWISFTPTGSWSTNTTYTGEWKREGDSAFIHVHLALAGAPTSANLTVNLPTNMTIDTSKVSGFASTVNRFGGGRIIAAGSGYEATVYYSTSTVVGIRYYNTNAGTNPQPIGPASVTQAAPNTFANLDSVDFYFKVPISGWEP